MTMLDIKLLRHLFLLLAYSILVGCSSGGGDGSNPTPQNVSTPDVVGLTQAAAENDILAASLTVGTVTSASSDTVANGLIISQSPAALALVAPGSTVNLVISSGPATIAVPNVVGFAQAMAEADIIAASLVVGNASSQSDNTVPAGNVISQNPVSGTLVTSGSAVDLVVSLGPAMISVPNVVGQAQATAEANIVAVNLVVGTVSSQNDNSIPAGNVISQNPLAGSMVGAGTAVDLIISLGPVAAFSDEFNSNSIGDWSLRHIVEGTTAQYTTLDIDQSTPGALTIVPTQTPGWFAADDGPLVFKLLSGNFSVHIRVLADSVLNPGQAPGSDFNSAGLMARNPGGATGPENYIMLNIGRQDGRIAGRVGSETKTTVNSSSTLFLDPGSNMGELILCRVGDNFHSFRFLSGDTGWTATDTFSRPDLPNTLQVGLVVNAFSAPADLRAEFDFIRLRPTPSSVNDCTP